MSRKGESGLKPVPRLQPQLPQWLPGKDLLSSQSCKAACEDHAGLILTSLGIPVLSYICLEAHPPIFFIIKYMYKIYHFVAQFSDIRNIYNTKPRA